MTSSLREKNLTYLEMEMQAMAKMLREFQPTWTFIPEGEPNGPNLLMADGQLLYAENANRATEKQLKIFSRSPNRLIFSPPDRLNSYDLPAHEENAFLTKRYDDRATDDHHGQYIVDITSWLKEHEVKVHQKPVSAKPYYLVVWGIGLGLHLKALMDTYNPTSVMLVDENLEGLYHSLDVIDWEEFVGHIRKNNIRFKIFVEKTKESIMGKISSGIQTESLLGLDGLMNYPHLQTPLLKVALAEFQGPKSANIATFIGFCVDEYNMMKNSFRNLRSGNKRMLTSAKIQVKAPVIIVGSGTSLERNLDVLRAWQDRAIIFSSGSSLKVLLKAGIIPDFHANLERAKSIHERHVELAEEGFDLSQIYAVMTTTIWPGVDQFFKDTVYFLRPALSPLAVFCEEEVQVLFNEGPQVTNTAFAFMTRLGVKTIYLLGVDLGTMDPGLPRAASAWKGIRPRKLTIPVRGNSGRTVFTDQALLQQKSTLESMIHKHRTTLEVFNLGDGALIAGAKTRRPEEVSLPPLDFDKKAHVDELVAQFPLYTRERFLAAWASASVRDSVAHLVNSMETLMARYDGWDSKLIKSLEDINQYLSKPVRQQYAPRLLRGSVLRMLMHANSVILRVDEDRRDEVVAGIKEVLSKQLRQLEFEAYSLADELESEDEAFQVRYE